MTAEEAQELATQIASRFRVFECDLCARAIAKALGKAAPATFGRVIDNLHPAGVPIGEWRQRYVSITLAPLIQWSTPIGDFFGKTFMVKKFNRWLLGPSDDHS